MLEVSGVGCKRIHPRQNKGDRSLLTPLQGNSGQDSKGEALCEEADSGVGAVFKRGKVRRYGDIRKSSFFCNCAWL